MSRRYGRSQCQYGAWHQPTDTCTCPTPAAVLAAAFPAPGRIAGTDGAPCGDRGCECKAWAIPDENRRVA